MKEMIEMIAKALVDNPDAVVVRAIEGEQSTVLELRVAPEDLGKVIGTRRETIPAKNDESAHCSQPQFLAESEHVESPFNSGLRCILSLREILDHYSEMRCGHCHKTSFFSRTRPLARDVAWANEIVVP